MKKNEIINLLEANHQHFVERINQLSEVDFMYAPSGKWTAGQQLEHIYKSVSPLILAFTVPKFVLKWKFGKANRSSKSYNDLVEKYSLKLIGGGKAPAEFIPKFVEWNEKNALVNKLNKAIGKIIARLKHISEEDLDVYILPHPLLGKVTLREMLFFTIHHVEHHQGLVTRNVKERSN